MYVVSQIQKVIALYADVFHGDFYSSPIRRQLEIQADRLTESHHKRDDSVCFQIGSWHPDLVGQTGERNEVESLDGRESDVAFEKAVNTMLSGNLSSLKEQIRATPSLLSARSQYGHRATLLHYMGTNGVESYRQVVPFNIAEIIDFLIAAGADQNLVAQNQRALVEFPSRKLNGLGVPHNNSLQNDAPPASRA